MYGSQPGMHGRAGLQVGDIFRAHGDDVLRRFPLSVRQRRVLRDVRRCRTAEMGGHVDVCADCGHRQPSYNSCRNRHCPTCAAIPQARWIEQRRERVLPVHHFHVVFTLPAQFREFLSGNDKLIYKIMFEAASETLLTLGEQRFGAQLGITAVLHTWTRDLRVHPHVHCVVTGGGLTRGARPRWVASRHKYLFPVAVMRALFRGKVVARLDKARKSGCMALPFDLRDEGNWLDFLQRLRCRKWVVYCKAPFGGAEQVFEYLGRYTHRVAISSARLRSVTQDEVVFRTRGDHVARMAPVEFIRRFLLHTLPPGFRKIRHYGLLSPSGVAHRLPLAMALLPNRRKPKAQDACPSAQAIEAEARRCPVCRTGRLYRELTAPTDAITARFAIHWGPRASPARSAGWDTS